jgi:2-(1,2-epoxy-1,2-dihydrophenyl)acetyl-CoA isomerase
MSSSETNEILCDIDDGVATITLNRPKVMNAFSDAMRPALREALREMGAREDVGCIVITGNGKAFCAGGDIASMTALQDANDTAVVARRIEESGTVLQAIREAPQPVVAAINGAAAGAGINLALACDLRLASSAAIFSESFVKIGLVPDWGGMYILPRLVGLQRAKELVYSGRRVYAEEAKEMGLVLDIVGQDTAMEEARAFAGRFVHAPTKTIGLAKNIMNQSYNLDHRTMLEMEAMAQAIARDSDFHKEAIRRFAAKEAPLFNWESFEKKAAE